MPDATELVKLLKRTALDAVLAAKPSNIMFGKVTSVSPLKINVEQKMELGAAQLVLSRNVTDFKTKISMLQSGKPWSIPTTTSFTILLQETVLLKPTPTSTKSTRKS